MRRVPLHLTANARALRRDATPAERLLWLKLRQARPRWTRQLPAGPFILDIACREAKLAVELDGSQHGSATGYDARRTEHLRALDWTVMRFWNHEVLANIDGVVATILHAVEQQTGQPPVFVRHRTRTQ